MQALSEAHNRLLELSNEELMDLVQDEDSHEAFAELQGRIAPRLHSMLLMNCPEEVEDITQDALFIAWENRKKFKKKSKIYTWIYRIAMNLSIDHARRMSVRNKGRIFSHPDRDTLTDLLENAAGPDSVEVDVLRTETVHAMKKALLMLHVNHRTIISLKELHGMRYEDIADALDIPVGTVRSRLSRARGELNLVLQQFFPEYTNAM